MRRETLNRLEVLERVKVGPEPMVMVVAPVDAPGHYWECSAYICQQTGWRLERDTDEAMPDFVQRVEREAEQHSETNPVFCTLTPSSSFRTP